MSVTSFREEPAFRNITVAKQVIRKKRLNVFSVTGNNSTQIYFTVGARREI